MNKDIYKEALKEVVIKCKSDREISKMSLFVALLGSVRDNEHVLNYSDLDILFVLDSDDSGAVNEEVLRHLKEIAFLVSKKYPIKISFLTHTIFDFYNYVDYEYLKHYSWGKILIGSQIKFNELFKEILRKKKVDSKNLKKMMFENIIHVRFNLVRRFVSFNKSNSNNYEAEIIKLFIDNILEVADWYLIAKGVWCRNKKELVAKFKNDTDEVNQKNIPFEAYRIRRNWNIKNPNKKEAGIFFKNSLLFIDECVALLNKQI